MDAPSPRPDEGLRPPAEGRGPRVEGSGEGAAARAGRRGALGRSTATTCSGCLKGGAPALPGGWPRRAGRRRGPDREDGASSLLQGCGGDPHARHDRETVIEVSDRRNHPLPDRRQQSRDQMRSCQGWQAVSSGRLAEPKSRTWPTHPRAVTNGPARSSRSKQGSPQHPPGADLQDDPGRLLHSRLDRVSDRADRRHFRQSAWTSALATPPELVVIAPTQPEFGPLTKGCDVMVPTS